MPTPGAPAAPGYFAHGDGSTPFTVVTADWCNAVQDEIVNVIQAASITLDKTQQNQLLAALNRMFAKSADMGGYVTVPDLANYAKKSDLAGYQPALGFTPVQQGGGSGQGANKVYIGWSSSGLKVQVDATDLGPLPFLNSYNVFSQTQTMNVDLNVGRNQSIGGQLGVNGQIYTNNGPITAQNARLRATYGARGSGDPNAATLLLDFPFYASGGGYQILPSGCIIQWGQSGPTGRLDVINFPVAFPNMCLSIVASEGGAAGFDSGGVPWRATVYGTQVINAAQFYMSCVQIDYAAGPLRLVYAADFGRWIAVGY